MSLLVTLAHIVSLKHVSDSIHKDYRYTKHDLM